MQIFYGILIANDVVGEARKLKKDLLLFKANFEKTYDLLIGGIWMLLQKMMFPMLWRKWMKECYVTATISVLVNGSSSEEFPLIEKGVEAR